MIFSKLSEHTFKKGKFTAPLNEFVTEMSKESAWYHGRMPEYIWLILIHNYYGRQQALIKCALIFKELKELAPGLKSPNLSEILTLKDDLQKKIYFIMLKHIPLVVLTPLTSIFTYNKFPLFATTFQQANITVSERIQKIISAIEQTSNHQSHFSTDIRFLVVYFNLLFGNIRIAEHLKYIIEEFAEYPNLNHDDCNMQKIRPTIRALELQVSHINSANELYLNLFWKSVYKMTECELYYIKHESDDPDSTKYLDKTKSIFTYYFELFQATKVVDNKMLVLLSIATYSYKRFLELINHKLYNTISGRSIIRCLIENYIMIKYLLIEENNHKDIWTEYQYYGIGQFKLIVERIKESNKQLTDSHIEVDYLEALVNEYKNQEFIDMDTSYFDKKNVRSKAKIVGEKELFDFYYDYDSAYEHGLWGAIRESSLLKCNAPTHEYHCMPDIENIQNVKSVWNDCLKIMNKTLSVLENLYGLPEHLKTYTE